MLQQFGFIIYFALLVLWVLVMGLCFYRIQAKGWINPKVSAYLLPFVINFFAAKFVFVSLNPLLTLIVPCLMVYFAGRKIEGLRIFGLTGGIATGKSTLAMQMADKLNEQLLIIDCDKINRELSLKGNAGYDLILSMLGPKKDEFLTPTKELIRQKLSDYVFNNPDFRRELTKKMGRKIFWQIGKALFNCIGKKKLVMIDAPILFETKILQYICYPIIVVGCPLQTQIARMIQNRGLTQQEARKRIQSQMPLDLKRKKADIYVENTGTPEDMFANVLRKLNKFLGKKK